MNNSIKEYTQKWQWEIMRSSKYLKTLILVMCLFLMSCKTMSYKQIQTISCTCNDTILQADKKLPIPYTESFSNDSIRISISKTTEYTKHIYFLQTNQKRVINYDLQGNMTVRPTSSRSGRPVPSRLWLWFGARLWELSRTCRGSSRSE